MNESVFILSSIQKKMDENTNMQTIMKAVAGLTVFTVFFCSFNKADTMKLAWIISMPLIVILFIFNSYYIKRNKECEFKIYRFEVEELNKKIKTAEIMGEVLPDVILDRKIIKPAQEVSLPIVYYAVMPVSDILVYIILIY